MTIFIRWEDGGTSVLHSVMWYRPIPNTQNCIIQTYGNDPQTNRSVKSVEVMEGDYVVLDKPYAEKHIV